MTNLNDFKALHEFRVAVFQRLRSLEAELYKMKDIFILMDAKNRLRSLEEDLSRMKDIIMLIDAKNEHSVDKLEKKILYINDQLTRNIACDQFLKSADVNEDREIISEDEKNKENPLFDF